MWLGQIYFWKTKLLSIFYGAKPNEKIDYLFNSVMTFSLDGQTMKFLLDNKGQTYYNGAIKGGDDAYDLTIQAVQNSNFK
jgi:hypothetical protein